MYCNMFYIIANELDIIISFLYFHVLRKFNLMEVKRIWLQRTVSYCFVMSNHRSQLQHAILYIENTFIIYKNV